MPKDAIACRLEQIGDERALVVNQGTVYLCLVRLVQKRWITAKWGTSENNRRAKSEVLHHHQSRTRAAEGRDGELGARAPEGHDRARGLLYVSTTRQAIKGGPSYTSIEPALDLPETGPPFTIS